MGLGNVIKTEQIIQPISTTPRPLTRGESLYVGGRKISQNEIIGGWELILDE